jgi:tetratricopeptide (TPR) repeat protein
MRQAIELDPSVETNYDNLAQILLEQKENVAAADVIRKALEVAPDSFQVYKLKGRMETQIGNFKRALESFSRAVALNVTDAESLLGLGLVQEKLAQLDQAAATFEKGIARFPRDAQFYQAYGRMLAESGTRLDSAVTLFEKALEIDNALPEAHYHLGKLLLAKGKAQESLPHLEAAAKLDPKSSRSHLSLANAYRSLGRQDDAARELKLVRELQEK